jgi:glycosyltransferase involved in cell wall biosynthesis
VHTDITLSVIIPVFNERLTVRQLVGRVRAVPIRKQIILVDDCSTDGTADVVRALAAEPPDAHNRVEAIFHPRNAGKGAAIRTAIPAVAGELALIQDADLEYDPAEYPALIRPILDGHADVVFGSRFLSGPHRVLFFYHMVGNRLLTLLSNLCTDLNLTDMETCYKVFSSDVLRRLNLTSNRFGIEPEITAKVARLGCRIYEVPITYHGREYWEGKKIGWKDGISAIWTILKYAVVDDLEQTDPDYASLRRLRESRPYREWVWSRLRPWSGDRVLEIGCGIGGYTGFLRSHALAIVTDADPQHLALLRTRFRHHDGIRPTAIDWRAPDLGALRAEGIDTVLALDGLAQLGDDDAALALIASLLPPGGRLLLQLPAAPPAARPYDRVALGAQLERHGFAVEWARYVDWLGAVTGRSRPVMPLLRIEQRWQPSRGRALLAVARRLPSA